MKRVSDHQITKDDADAGRLDGHPEEPGEFQKAAPEVLAKRRILKVRRSAPIQRADPPKAPNPFAVIAPTDAPDAGQTAPPQPASEKQSEDTAAPVEEKKKTEEPTKPTASGAEAEKQDETKKSPDDINSDASKKPDQTEKPTNVQQPDDAKASDAAHEKPAEPPAAEEPAKTDEQPPAVPAEKSAEAAPKPDADAKADQLANTDAPAATEAVPAVSKPNQAPEAESAARTDAGDAPADEASKQDVKDAPSAPEPEKTVAPPAVEPEKAPETTAPVPASKTNGTPFKAPITFGSFSGTAPLTFAKAAAADSGSFDIQPVTTTRPPAPAPAKKFKEAPVQTGEESDDELFRERAKLYDLETAENGTSRWKERGVGTLKVNRHLESNKARLIMRTEATLKVILNSPIFEGFKFDRATERSLRFPGYDPEDPEKRLTFLVRFSTREISEQLVEAVEKAQKIAGDSKNQE